jgi:DNA-binding CsgD family transcriptional regulator
MVMALCTATRLSADVLRPTSRQLQVLEVYAATGSYARTGKRLGISPRTVRNHLVALRDWYNVEHSVQAYRAALRAGHLTSTPVQ